MENIKQLYEDKEKTIEAFPRVFMPVGSLYWNENDISSDISKYFIGSWQRVTDKFIVAAGTEFPIGTTGGSKNHYHNFKIGLTMFYGAVTLDNFSGQGAYKYSNNTYAGNTSDGGNINIKRNNSIGTTYTEASEYIRESVGDTSSSSNLPPYQAFYCWKRIS